MSILTSRISYFGNEGSGKEVELKDWTRLTIKRGLDATSNTVEIRLKNSVAKKLSDGSTVHRYVSDSKTLSIDGTYELTQGDAIKIWLRWSDSASDTITYDDNSSYLLTISEVKEWDCVYEDNKTELVLKCVDKTYEVLNKLWASAYPVSKGYTCPTMAQVVIRNATDGAKNGYDQLGNITKKDGYGVDARLMTGTYAQQAALSIEATGSPPAYIETKRIDNSAYPAIAMSKVWKPVYEWLKEMNGVNYTNDADDISAGTYVQNRTNRFYIDQNNRYHQFYPNDTVDYTIVAGSVSSEGTIADYKMTKKTFDIINMVIYNSGKDLDNVGILWYYFDEFSKERKLKMKYIPMLDIASEGNGSLRSAEVSKGNISVASDGVVTILAASGTTSWGETYTTEADYKDKFREYGKYLGRQRAMALTKGRGSPRWKGNITLKKGAYYTPGELTKVTALAHGINLQLLRIVDVTHQITTNSWTSQLELEEDERKYGEVSP